MPGNGALKRGENTIGRRSNIAGLETDVDHREQSRLRPIGCEVNDLVTALCAITNRGRGHGEEGDGGRGRYRVKAAADIFNY